MLGEGLITQSYELLAPGNSFTDFTSDMVFTEPFDFWDPEISLHEMISIGGIPDPGSVSLTGQPATSLGENGYFEDQQSLQDVAILSSMGLNSTTQQHKAPQRAGKISGLQSLKPQPGADAKHKRILPGLFIRKDAFNNNFIGTLPLISFCVGASKCVGLNSLGATLACGLREISESNPSLSKATSFNWMIDAGPHVDELDTAMEVEPAMVDLPTKSFAASSIKGTIVHNVTHNGFQVANVIFQLIFTVFMPSTQSLMSTASLIVGNICMNKSLEKGQSGKFWFSALLLPLAALASHHLFVSRYSLRTQRTFCFRDRGTCSHSLLQGRLL